jgi:hypothetical protein
LYLKINDARNEQQRATSVPLLERAVQEAEGRTQIPNNKQRPHQFESSPKPELIVSHSKRRRRIVLEDGDQSIFENVRDLTECYECGRSGFAGDRRCRWRFGGRDADIRRIWISSSKTMEGLQKGDHSHPFTFHDDTELETIKSSRKAASLVRLPATANRILLSEEAIQKELGAANGSIDGQRVTEVSSKPSTPMSQSHPPGERQAAPPAATKRRESISRFDLNPNSSQTCGRDCL